MVGTFLLGGFLLFCFKLVPVDRDGSFGAQLLKPFLINRFAVFGFKQTADLSASFLAAEPRRRALGFN
jgi:hypothetical protein